jgi:hypothetical protein
MKWSVLPLLAVLALGSCKFKATVSTGTELKGEGITFQVPDETSSSSSGTGGIEFNGESVKAKTDGKTLTVDGKAYGAMKPGDVVNLREKGKVLVNGAERSPVSP